MIESLLSRYNSTTVQSLINYISIIPEYSYASQLNSIIQLKINQIETSNLIAFFDEINQSDSILDESIIENHTFLYCYYTAFNHAIRSSSNQKSKNFAQILSQVANEKISPQKHEHLSKVFDELTEIEFSILAIKEEHEQNPKYNSVISKIENPNEMKITSIHWDDFVECVTEKLNLEKTLLFNILSRLEKSGCYQIHKGFHNVNKHNLGDTTPLFKMLKSCLA